MAHEINVTNGKVSMFYTGETPWHSLGQNSETPVRDWETLADMAGLGFPVELTPNYVSIGGEYRPCGSYSTFRSDTGQVLGNRLSANYRPIQNYQAFNFLNTVAAEGGIEFHTAGALGRGERVWMLAKLPGRILLGTNGPKGKARDKDEVEKFLLLYNSHDGSKAMMAFWTPIRVVCANTVRAALQGRGGEGIVIRHSGEIDKKVNEAQRILGLTARYYDEITPILQQMASTKLEQDQAKKYFESVYPDPSDTDKQARVAETRRATRDLLLDLFGGKGVGLDMPSIKGSVWAAYNAVTEFTDHYQAVYSAKPENASKPARSDEGMGRLADRIWFGDLAEQKQTAFEHACELVGAEVPNASAVFSAN